MKRFIVQETFEHEGTEYAQGAIYEVDDKIKHLMPLWIGEGKVRDPDLLTGNPFGVKDDDEDDEDGDKDDDKDDA